MSNSPLAGQPAPASVLVDVPKLVTAYYTGRPDPAEPAQRVTFGTSGHRGSAFELSFNEYHVLAITQAICQYRKNQGTDGPLFVGFDTHALSEPAFASVLEVLAANGVESMIARDDEYTPTPAVSVAILTYNRGRKSGLADGIVITPSHNPPDNGGIKYNPPNGGPADTDATGWIQDTANDLLKQAIKGVKRMPYAQALRATTTRSYDFLGAYVDALGAVIDLKAISDAKLHVGVDPLGGAGVHYWPRIAEQYKLDLDVLNNRVDPTFSFMSLDWDGKIRMDPSSAFVMQHLISRKDQFDVIVACDTDHDRHGIVARSTGLLPSNHYLAVCIDYLFSHRPGWSKQAAIGKTVVSSAMIDRVVKKLGRRLYEVPVGFKWFVSGLYDGSLGFGGEESAGASFLRMDGTPWSTDKDGIIAALLAAEMTAVLKHDPGEHYQQLAKEFGDPFMDRVEAPANAQQKQALAALSAEQIKSTELAGDKITSVISKAPGNGAAIGGVKVATDKGWFAARPSGTEDIYKIYVESFVSQEHLQRIAAEAQTIVDGVVGGGATSPKPDSQPKAAAS